MDRTEKTLGILILSTAFGAASIQYFYGLDKFISKFTPTDPPNTSSQKNISRGSIPDPSDPAKKINFTSSEGQNRQLIFDSESFTYQGNTFYALGVGFPGQPISDLIRHRLDSLRKIHPELSEIPTKIIFEEGKNQKIYYAASNSKEITEIRVNLLLTQTATPLATPLPTVTPLPNQRYDQREQEAAAQESESLSSRTARQSKELDSAVINGYLCKFGWKGTGNDREFFIGGPFPYKKYQQCYVYAQKDDPINNDKEERESVIKSQFPFSAYPDDVKFFTVEGDDGKKYHAVRIDP